MCDGNPGVTSGGINSGVDPKLLQNVTDADSESCSCSGLPGCDCDEGAGGDQAGTVDEDVDVQAPTVDDPGHEGGQSMGGQVSDHDCTTAHPCDMGNEITSSPHEMGHAILNHEPQAFPTPVGAMEMSNPTGQNIVHDAPHEGYTHDSAMPSDAECMPTPSTPCEGGEGENKKSKINKAKNDTIKSNISLRELIPHPTAEDREKLHEELKGKLAAKSTVEESPTTNSTSEERRRGEFAKPTESSTQTTDKKKKKDVVVSRPPIIYHPPPEIYHRPDIVVHRPPLLIHRPSIIYHQPPVIVHRPAVVYHQPPLVFHQPPPAVQQPLLVSHDTFKMHPSALYTHMGSVVNKVGSYVGVPHGPIVNYPRTPFYGSTGYGPAPGGGYREFGNHHISYASEEDRDQGREEAPEDGIRHVHIHHHDMGGDEGMMGARDDMGHEGGEAPGPPGDEGRGGSPFEGGPPPREEMMGGRMDDHGDERGMGVGHAPPDFMGRGGMGHGEGMPEPMPERDERPAERGMRGPSDGEGGMMPPQMGRQHFERDFNGPSEEMGGGESLEPPMGHLERPGRW